MLENPEIFFRQGKALCSTRNPLKEAQNWLKSIKEQMRYSALGTIDVLVLGCGSGFHLLELERNYPSLSICVFDFEKHLFDQWKKRNPDSKVNWVDPDHGDGFWTLEFRPCWIGYELEYKNLSARIRGSGSLNIKEQARVLEEDLQDRHAKLIRLMREFVK